jgi:hypothetical protein
MRTNSSVRLLLLLGLFICVWRVDPATAGPRPSVKFSFPASATAGARIPFTWQAGKVPAGARVVLQRKVGTARVWKTVLSLSGHSGSANAPALPLGAYQLKIAVVAKRGRIVGQRSRTLHVFGLVPLGTLVKGLSVWGSGTHTTANYTFNYVAAWGGSGSIPMFTVAGTQNTCRSVHLDFDSNGEARTADTAAVSVVQQAADPQLSEPASAGVATGSLDAKVAPGQSWAVNVLHPSGTGTNLVVYVNGVASCFSAEPWTAS